MLLIEFLLRLTANIVCQNQRVEIGVDASKIMIVIVETWRLYASQKLNKINKLKRVFIFIG